MSSNVLREDPRDTPMALLPLENGDHLTADEFLRRYEAMDEDIKAELIDGIVYMAPPTRADHHGQPDSFLNTWLGFYSISTPGTRAAINTTVRFENGDVAQPDGILRVLPEAGGAARIDSEGYINGTPELVIEVSASTASLDSHQKRDCYRAGGVMEYLVWRTRDGALDWWSLQAGEYRRLAVEADGILRSRVFRGLWLDVAALLAEDGQKVLAALQEGIASPEHATFCAELQAGRN